MSSLEITLRLVSVFKGKAIQPVCKGTDIGVMQETTYMIKQSAARPVVPSCGYYYLSKIELPCV